jgi:peptidyl-prolyl cis-trans isomerase SurA
MKLFGSIAAALAATACLAGGAHAQVVGDAVAAVVNDQPISTFDVSQRMRLLLLTSGTQLPEGAEEQLRQRAMRDLIDEELKRQETERYEVEVTDEEVQEELARIAGQSGITIDDLIRDLNQNGIAVETLMEKIRAEEAWDRLVRGRFSNRVSVSEGEIDTMLAEMRSEKQAEQFLLSEICLPVENAQNRQQIYGVGMQMLTQMQQGVPFQALAQQFSVCPSAARGGDLGWMRAAEVDDEVMPVVRQLNEGNVSTPVEMQSGDLMKLVALRGKRAAAEKGDPSYELAYAGVPKSVYSRREAEEKLSRLPLTNPCDGDSLSTDLGANIGVQLLPMLPIAQIREPFQNAVIDLRRGDRSELLESTNAYHMVYVCEMDEGLGLPRRRMVENRLEAQQFDLLSRRYLRDVERDSDVDIRMEEVQAQES